MDIFIHLPRTGGTSISRALIMQYGVFRTYQCIEVSPGVFKTKRSIRKGGAAVIMGHVPFGVDAQLDIELPRYFTMMRDPFDRLVSHYLFVRSNKNHYLHHEVTGQNLSFPQYILSAISPELRNGVVRQLSGHANAWDSCADISKLYDLAAINLKSFSAVGLNDRFNESLALFGARLGWTKPCHIFTENAASVGSQALEHFEQYRDLVYSTNDADYFIFNTVREQFNREIEGVPTNISRLQGGWTPRLKTNIHRLLEWI